MMDMTCAAHFHPDLTLTFALTLSLALALTRYATQFHPDLT